MNSVRYQLVYIAFLVYSHISSAQNGKACDEALFGLTHEADYRILPSSVHSLDGSQIEQVEYPDGTRLVAKLDSTGKVDSLRLFRPDGENRFLVVTGRDLESYELPMKDLIRDGELEGKFVLDIGCGHCLAVADMRARGILAYGIDIYVPPTTRSAYVKMARAQSTGFQGQSFDYAISYFSVFSYISRDNPESMRVAILGFEELSRILKPGGIILLGQIDLDLIRSIISKIEGLSIDEQASDPGISFDPPVFGSAVIRKSL